MIPKTELNTRNAIKTLTQEVDMPFETKIKIANSYMEFLMDKVLDGEEVTLPAKTGTLQIRGAKKKLSFNEDGTPRLPPNWGATKKLWDRDPDAKAKRKVVYCLNEETNGVVYKAHWSKNAVSIENKMYYSLILTRANKRAINKRIKEGKEYLIKT